MERDSWAGTAGGDIRKGIWDALTRFCEQYSRRLYGHTEVLAAPLRPVAARSRSCPSRRQDAVTASVYPKYSAIFNSLSNLPSVVSQLGTVQQATVTDLLAEYLIVQNTANGPNGFLVYLMLGDDGIWRIDGM
jgi:hypothetical protein